MERKIGNQIFLCKEI